MFVFLSKVLDLLLAPLTWGLLLVAVGGALRRRRARLSAGVQVLGWLVLYVPSTEPMANLLQRWVEAGAESTYQADTVYDAVIVLGGMVDADASERSGLPEYTPAVERILRGFELLRAGRARRGVISGGTLGTRARALGEAGSPGRQLGGWGVGGGGGGGGEGEWGGGGWELWGVGPERIVREARSRNTRENALESE